ncbi:MAG: FAD-dependent oxidoreductase [Herpetosiphonaceae bacterium]|nr:FAD-dependent oxidoreductase [Herpetosiphonaceae bacterium]
MKILVVGAGLAGLTCARLLHKAGQEVVVLEAADGVGGRVRSDQIDGYTCDRGFQVLFDGYPAARRQLDLTELELRAFDPGALICRNGQRSILTDPLRDRQLKDVIAAIRTPEIPLLDKLRTLRLVLALGWSGRDPQRFGEQSTIAFLQAQGFTQATIDRFFRPFYGGIFLERPLATTAAAFAFYFEMLARGNTVIPAAGMGAITEQLAAPLAAAGAIRLNTSVESLRYSGDRVSGVRLRDGQELDADAVVLATDAPAAHRLVDMPTPAGARQTVAIYFAGRRPVYQGKKIMLNANADAFVNNAQQLSAVAPECAPEGRHLLSATILGTPAGDDRELVGRAMRDLRRMWAGDAGALAALDTYYPLKVYRITYAQFDQPPGISSRLPGNQAAHADGTPIPGLYIAAEWTEASSINGAILSGEQCATLVQNEQSLPA